MRPQLVILVTLAVLGVLTALPLGKGNKEATGGAAAVAGDDATSASSWPCCDDCRLCTRSIPPKCQCNDISLHGCHPECKKCVRYTLTADDINGIQMPAAAAAASGTGTVVTYRCADMLKNFCKRRCTPAPAAAFLGEAF